jgi:hypothetical protein
MHNNTGVSASEFYQFEEAYKPYDIQIDDIYIWPRLRFDIYRQIRRKTGHGQAHTSIEPDNKSDKKKGIKLWLKNLYQRNPFLSKEHEFVFFGHERRKQESDGLWWDIYCDPVYEACSLDSVHLEVPYLLDHRTPAKTNSIRYLEIIEYGGTIQRKLGFNNTTLADPDKNHLRRVENGMKEWFGVEIDLIEKVTRALDNRRCRLWLYERLLNKINPSVAIVVVSYTKDTFIEACKLNNIPVVELQHGTITSNHVGYEGIGQGMLETFPDYLLTWGQFWVETADFPIPNERIIPVGFPYLEQRREYYSDETSDEQIIFISQGTIGDRLSKFAMEVQNHPNIPHNIIYKLHPGEYDRWKTEYPWLMDSDIEVIDGPEPTLYSIFSESTAQIGVSSTALYEGLAFGLETYLYNYPGSEALQPLVDENSAEEISGVEQLANTLGSGSEKFNKEYYFQPNAEDTICAVLNKISKTGTQYIN